MTIYDHLLIPDTGGCGFGLIAHTLSDEWHRLLSLVGECSRGILLAPLQLYNSARMKPNLQSTVSSQKLQWNANHESNPNCLRSADSCKKKGLIFLFIRNG